MMTSFIIKEGSGTVRHLGSVILNSYKYHQFSDLQPRRYRGNLDKKDLIYV